MSDYERPALPVGDRWGATPSHHGAGLDATVVYPGRAVLELDDRVWPHLPENCPGEDRCEWVLNATVLICPGCGLDCT